MQLSQGFRAEVKEEEGGMFTALGPSPSQRCSIQVQHQQPGCWNRVLGGDGAAASPTHLPNLGLVLSCSPGIPQRGFSLRFAL